MTQLQQRARRAPPPQINSNIYHREESAGSSSPTPKKATPTRLTVSFLPPIAPTAIATNSSRQSRSSTQQTLIGSSEARSPSPTRTITQTTTPVSPTVTVFVTPTVTIKMPGTAVTSTRLGTPTPTPSAGMAAVNNTVPTAVGQFVSQARPVLSTTGVMLIAVLGSFSGIALIGTVAIVLWRRRKRERSKREIKMTEAQLVGANSSRESITDR